MQLKRWQGANVKKDERIKAKILAENPRLTQGEVDQWLKRNPPPDHWESGKYAWAWTAMPTGKLLTWWRRQILRWNI